MAESLVKQLEDHVRSLKRIHEESKQPITDDVPGLRVFCMLVERILRFGQREKLSFWGDRKDYWNYFCECLQGNRALTDSLQAVQRYTHLQTSQGKGRALLRESLVKHNLADMVQIAAMAKQTTDWYRPDAIMRHKQLSSLLINSLYELNDVEFQLSQRGQDLDDNWPSFSKKAFGSSPQPMGYSTYATDLGSLTPRAFTVDSADGSMDTQDIAKPLARVHKRSKAESTASYALEKYMEILEASIQIESSEETNADSGAQSQDSEEEEVVDKEIPIPVKKFRKKLEGWQRTLQSQISDLETELEHERQEREADLADTERLQQSLKEQLDDFRLAENQLKSKTEILTGQLAAKTKESDERKRKIESMMSKLNAWEVETVEWQTRLDEAQEEIKTLQDDLSESRHKFNALEADYVFLCSAKEELDEKLSESEKQYSERDAVMVEVEKTVEQLKRNEEEMKQDLEQERQLRGDLEGKLLEADIRISKLLSEYEQQQSDSESAFEQRNRHVSELQDLVSNQEKLLVAQESRLEKMKMTMQKSIESETSQRKEKEEMNVKVTEIQKEIEEQQQVIKDLRKQLTVTEEKLQLKETELIHKTDALHQLSAVVKSEQQSDSDRHDEDKVKGGTDVSLAQLSEQLIAAMQRESEAKESLMLANKEVQELRSGLEKETGRRKLIEDEKRQLEKRFNEVEQAVSEERQRWKERLEREDTNRQEPRESFALLQRSSKEVQEPINNTNGNSLDGSSVKATFEADIQQEVLTKAPDDLFSELEQLRQRLSEEGQKRMVAEQECASMKFQMSTDVMQYKQQQDAVKEHRKEISDLQRIVSDSNRKLQDSKTQMQELSKQRNAAQEEKELLDNQVATLQRNLKELEVEVGSLQDQLFEVTAERDQKRRLCLEQSEQLSHLQEQTKFSDQQLSKKLSEMKEEHELIKEQVVNIVKQKVSLWEENLDLQNDLALHLSRTWADETLSTHCVNCKTAFGLAIRKHHCRSCGQIFCGTCCYRFLLLASDSKPSRVCVTCDEMITEAKEKGSVTPTGKRQRTRTQQSSLGSSFREDPEKATTEERPMPEHGSDVDCNETQVSPDGSSVDGQTMRERPGELSPEKRNVDGVAAKSRSSEVYAIIDEEDICKADPSYVPRNKLRTTSGSKGAITVNDELTGTGPGAPSVTEKEWTVKAGTQHRVVILVIKEQTRICWQFKSDSTSLSFGIRFKRQESQHDGQELMPVKRLTSSKACQSGELTSQRPGIYSLLFDNSESRSSSPCISYRVEVRAHDS